MLVTVRIIPRQILPWFCSCCVVELAPTPGQPTHPHSCCFQRQSARVVLLWFRHTAGILTSFRSIRYLPDPPYRVPHLRQPPPPFFFRNRPLVLQTKFQKLHPLHPIPPAGIFTLLPLLNRWHGPLSSYCCCAVNPTLPARPQHDVTAATAGVWSGNSTAHPASCCRRPRQRSSRRRHVTFRFPVVTLPSSSTQRLHPSGRPARSPGRHGDIWSAASTFEVRGLGGSCGEMTSTGGSQLCRHIYFIHI